MFVQNSAIFTNTLICNLENEKVREMVDFGVLPTPKLTEDQDTYYSHTDCLFTCQLLPSAIKEEDALRSVYIANALNAFGYEIERPVYYEIVLKTRLTRDRDSTRMMDLVLDGRRYGFEYMAENDFQITHVKVLREYYSREKYPNVSTYAMKVDLCKLWMEQFMGRWNEMVKTLKDR